MVDELAPIPLEIRDVMLFDDEAAPVRGSAGKDNPRARISGQNFVVCCTQNRNIGLWLHRQNLMILRPSRFGRTLAGSVKVAGRQTGFLCRKRSCREPKPFPEFWNALVRRLPKEMATRSGSRSKRYMTREPEYSRQLTMWRNYNSDRAINQGRLRELDDLREGDRAPCPVTPASYLSGPPGCPAASSMRTSTSGSSTATSPSKSLLRNAVRNASTTLRCSERWALASDSLA